ncbi:MAG TPA: PLP-dependent aminotransferase family protein [candidate division Zixibacteria bacterium]|nr:PLP-dependent aminotransferase family protein [candidate division Zixibacteria bacterium]HER00484.1 PLP-dependent aminotransferase family protein [candidate division Zixibacteria bacterium]
MTMDKYYFSTMASRMRRSEIRELLKLTRQPGTISFGGGLPDPNIFPRKAVEEAAVRAIREQGNLALQYSPTEGEPFMKEEAAAFMTRLGDEISAEEIIVVSSSQQALDLLSKVFIDPGDAVIIERPSYVGALQSFRAFGAEFHGVDIDSEGIIPSALEEKILELRKADKKARFIYLIPDFQNPSGINLSIERRKQVIEIASRHNILIVEDSPYRELRFEGELLPSVRSLDKEGRVIQMKTFSKIFVPGFRIGWLSAPPEVLDKLVMSKQSTDLCTSAFVSMISGYLLKDGHIEKQIEISKEVYVKKCRTMLDALEKYMPELEGLSWSKPEGGMFLWVRLPEYMDTLEMIPDAVEAKVAYVIGSAFYTDGSGKNTMRLNYSYPSHEQIREGIKRLAGIVEKREAARSGAKD